MRRLAVTALITLTLLAATSLPAFAEGPPAIVPSYPHFSIRCVEYTTGIQCWVTSTLTSSGSLTSSD